MSDEARQDQEESDLATPSLPGGAPEVEIREGRYLVRFARGPEDLHAALRLRYEVFNLELDEGLAHSHISGRDEDRFDAACHHLLVFDTSSDAIIGTYRMQTSEMARSSEGFYSDGEYHLSDLGDDVLARSVETGRACVAREHRKKKVLFGLWRGLAAYMVHTHKRYLFGCCSLTSQDPVEGVTVMERLRRDGLVHPTLATRVREDFACRAHAPDPGAVKRVTLPTLFGTYLRFGALVCSGPAIDREFGTIDYLVLMDVDGLSSRTRATFFGEHA